MPVDSRFWAFEASDAAIQYVRVYGENVYLENIVSVECFSLKWNFNFARKYNAEYMISAQFMNTMHNIAQTHTHADSGWSFWAKTCKTERWYWSNELKQLNVCAGFWYMKWMVNGICCNEFYGRIKIMSAWTEIPLRPHIIQTYVNKHTHEM